jgi:hypothetical protein
MRISRQKIYHTNLIFSFIKSLNQKIIFQSKQKLVSAYETWQKNNIDRLDLVEKTIKQYSVVDDIIELAKKIGFDLSERDLEIHSTEISFYNTNNVAQLLNDMKPKAKESRADKIARVKAYQQSVAVN